MNMNLPLPLLKIVENTIQDLPDDERVAFYAVINTVAEGKDLSNTHWAFLGSELRALYVELPKRLRLPKYIQAIIYEVIAGMDRLAAGRAWPEADKVAKIASNKAFEATFSAKRAAGYAGYAATFAAKVAARSEEAATYVDAAVTNLLYAAAYAAGIKAYVKAVAKAQQRQRDTLLALIESAPAE
jgi:hypothetical protein